MYEKTEYDTPDEFSEESENDALIRRENEFKEEFSDLVFMDNPMLRDIKKKRKVTSSPSFRFIGCQDGRPSY